MIPTLSGACYGIRSMVHFSNINTLKSIYYTYFHSVIKYGIIFFVYCERIYIYKNCAPKPVFINR